MDLETGRTKIPGTHREFDFDNITVFFKHTDYYGFVHPYNYFEWMGYAREAFFQELVPNFLEVINRKIKMVTSNVQLRILRDAQFGTRIKVRIYSQRVKRVSYEVVFNFYDQEGNILLAEGLQRLSFLDEATNEPAPIPAELKKVILLHEKK